MHGICSEELFDSLRVFFFRLGGAMGPLDARLSVVLECVNFVLAITSGSVQKKRKEKRRNSG